MVRKGLMISSMLGTVVGVLIVCYFVFLGQHGQSSLHMGVAMGVTISLVSVAPLGWLAWSERNLTSDAELERREFERTAKQATQELRRQTEILLQRERQLADRFLQYQTWMEYPIEDDRDREARDSKQDGSHPSEDSETFSTALDGVSKERALVELLEQEAERAFHKIKANAYTVDGQFSGDLVRDDLRQLIINVARIYHPESNNPLLETSLEQLLRAASRTCLQLLVLVERVPINLSEFNLQSLYTYLRRGLRAYQVYQSVRPLLPYFHYASYAGRIMLGSNPISLGAQWALWKLGSKGATAATRHLVNRQALSFLHDSITVIGFEVAGIYDPELRHRDKHWIFGVELTELLSRFPISREALVRAFAEIGNLPLRSEYDRVFLYRCLAAHRSGGPQRFLSRRTLANPDRQWVAKRLSSFASQHLAFRDTQRLTRWQSEVQERLDVTLDLKTGPSSLSEQAQLLTAAESLVAFLLVERQQDVEELTPLLDRSQLFRQVKQDDRNRLLNAYQADPPSIYELPDLDPQSPHLMTLITDMARATAATVWQVGGSLDAIEWAGEFFRIDSKKLQALVQGAYRDELQHRMKEAATLPKLSVDQMTAILETAPPDAVIEAVFPEPHLEWKNASSRERSTDEASRLLLAWETRLVLIEISTEVGLIWSNDAPATVAMDKSLLQTTARVTGGMWHGPAPHPDAFIFSRSLTSRRDYDFQMLKTLIERERD